MPHQPPPEDILFQVRQSPALLALQLLILTLVAAGLFLIFQNSILPETGPLLFNLSLKELASFGAVLIVGFVGMVRILEYETTLYTATTKRVQHDFGILRRTSQSIPLDQVETLDAEQSLIGRIVGYGTLVIRPTSAVMDFIRFTAISDPKDRRQEIDDHLP